MKPLKDVQDDVDELKLKVKELEYEIEKLKEYAHWHSNAFSVSSDVVGAVNEGSFSKRL